MYNAIRLFMMKLIANSYDYDGSEVANSFAEVDIGVRIDLGAADKTSVAGIIFSIFVCVDSATVSGKYSVLSRFVF